MREKLALKTSINHLMGKEYPAIVSLLTCEVSLPPFKSKDIVLVFEKRERKLRHNACNIDYCFIKSSNIFLMERLPCIKSSCNII